MSVVLTIGHIAVDIKKTVQVVCGTLTVGKQRKEKEIKGNK